MNIRIRSLTLLVGLLVSACGTPAAPAVISTDAPTAPPPSPLLGHFDAVLSVAYSPDGKLLASASADTNIILWNTQGSRFDNQPLNGHLAPVNSVAFSPDGKTLASASSDNTIAVWDMDTRDIINKLSAHTDRVNSVAFSPDSQTLASASNDKTILLWKVPKAEEFGLPQPIGKLAAHTDAVNSVAFSPDGKLLASASSDKTIIVWNVATRQPVAQLAGHTAKVNSVAFSPNGKLLASASDDKTIIVWDVATRQPVGRPLNRHLDAVSSVAFSPDGKLLASGSWDFSCLLWDVATLDVVAPRMRAHRGAVTSVAFSPDGKTLASAGADHNIFLWNVPAQIAAAGVTIETTQAATAPGQSIQTAQHKKTYADLVVGFAQVSPESDWRSANTFSMKKTAQQLGVTLKFNDMQSSQNNQLRAIRMFIASRVDVIAVTPVVEVGYEAVFQEAKAAGIPIILLDRQVAGLEDCYVSRLASDFTEEGRKAGRALAKLMNGQANIVELSGIPGYGATFERGSGFREILHDYPGMKIIDTQTGNFTRGESEPAMAVLLKKYGNKINALFAQNDDMAIGAIKAIEAYGLKPGVDIKIVSIDATHEAFEAMIAGKLNATVEYNPMMGPQFYELSLKIVNGETVPRWVKTNEDIFYPDNAAEILPTRKY